MEMTELRFLQGKLPSPPATAIILILSVLMMVSALPTQAEEETERSPCHLLDPASPVPEGFGAPHNPLSQGHELVMRASCSDTQASVEVGNGSHLQFIYQQGYELRNNQWQPFTYHGANKMGPWIIARADATLSRSVTRMRQNNFFVAYICHWRGQRVGWKCGCRDSACSTRHWQLQAFRHDSSPRVGDSFPMPPIEFLKSDVSTPSATTYVSDQNRGDGSGSSPEDAQELQSALQSARPGHSLVAVAQTPGTIEYWEYPAGLSFPNGRSDSYVMLQAREGDGIIISKDERFASFRKADTGQWELYDADKKIWRSKKSFYGGPERLYGVWYEFGHPHFLLAYSNVTELSATYGGADSPWNYAGPGAYLHSDGHVYIRMQKPHPGKYSKNRKWTDNLWPGHTEAVEDGALNYPVSEDPNDYEIHLYKREGTSAFDGNYVKIGAGINTMGFRNVWQGDSNIIMRRGTDITWREFTLVMSGHDFDVQRRRIANGSKRHLARAEWKFNGWLAGDRGAFIENCCGEPGHSFFFKNSTITDYHELLVGGLHSFRFRNSVIFNILDDGIQAHPDLSGVEIGYSFVINSAIGGNSGSNGSDGGEWYVHHNVIDARTQKGSNWRAETTPPFLWLNHSAFGNQPRKNYNNTVLFGPDVEDEQGTGFSHNGNQNNTASEAHEVFNNLFIRHGVQRYDPSWAGNLGSRTDFAQRSINVSANESNEYWDYNLYYRDVPRIGGSFTNGLLRWVRKGKTNDQRSFNSLDDFRSSDLFDLSKQSGSRRSAYPPGFEANGTDARPELPSFANFPNERFNYRPAPSSAVTTASAESLSGEEWWSGSGPNWGRVFPWNEGEQTLAPSRWKGALDPNGSSMTVGVQKP